MVGFDVDDTLSFSAPAFNALEPAYPRKRNPAKELRGVEPSSTEAISRVLESAQRRVRRPVHPEANRKATPRSPSSAARRHFHISRRQGTGPPTNTVTRRLERMFGVNLRHPVVQTNLKDKTPFIAHAASFAIPEIQTAILRQLSAPAPCLSGCNVPRLPMPRTGRTTANSTKSYWRTLVTSNLVICAPGGGRKRIGTSDALGMLDIDDW